MSYWIVIVDDEPFCLTNAKNLLREQNMRVSCLRSGKDLLTFMETHDPDLILLDILMPEMDGFETYHALRVCEDKKGVPQTPVIFLTGEDNHETERRGLKAGASDFIHKPFDKDILIKRINNAIINSKMIENLTEEATLDKLTGFFNKASGTEKISSLCQESVGSLVIMDLDNFKLVNDLYGHDMGDRILVAFAGIVRHNVRTDDVVSRIGGDEFMGFFSDLTDDLAVASLTKRLNTQLSEEAASMMGKEHGIPLGISIGVAVSSDEQNAFQILFRYADSALYEAKRQGKHGYVIYNQLLTKQDSDNDLEQDLERITQIVAERGEGKGAMILGQEAFTWNYQYIERFVIRYGGVATRILFSISSDEQRVLFSEIVSEFGKSLQNTLRKIDIILQWQHNQYFVVLPQLKQKDMPRVIERVLGAWEKRGYHKRVRIDYVTSFLSAENDQAEGK